MVYQHPLAYLVGLEGLALMRAWSGDADEAFVHARLAEVRGLLADETLNCHAGVHVERVGTIDAYRQWAATYDDPGNELLELDLPVIDAILEALPVGTAVETACGTGRLVRRLAGRGHRVVGVDISLDMIEQARRSVAGASFLVADLQDLPLPDASVDLVTNALALTHVTDLDRVVAEFARVLRPGGVALVSDVHPDLVALGSVVKAQGPSGEPQLAPCHQRTVGDYLRAAISAGFRVRGYEELPRLRDVTAPSAPGREPTRMVGTWPDWPWTLLDWVPEASRLTWDVPAVMVWHLELD